MRIIRVIPKSNVIKIECYQNRMLSKSNVIKIECYQNENLSFDFPATKIEYINTQVS